MIYQQHSAAALTMIVDVAAKATTGSGLFWLHYCSATAVEAIVPVLAVADADATFAIYLREATIAAKQLSS